MSLNSFADLQAANANWMGRAGNTDYTGNIPDFIQLCEARLNYGSDDPQFPSPPLRTRQMEVPSTTVTVLVSTNTVILPSDFLALRRNYAVAPPNNVKLDYVTPNEMDTVLPTTPSAPPKFFTIMGNQMVFPAPLSSSTTIVFGYYQKIPALTSTNTSNWLMAASPGIYLSGTQLEGATFVRDLEDAMLHARSFTGLVRAFMKQDINARYSGGPLVMRGDQGTP